MEMFIDEINEFLDNGEISNELLLVVHNAMSRLDDNRYDRKQAKKYIYDWYLTLIKEGYKFSKYEQKLFQIVKPERKLNILGAIASSILIMFRH